MEKGFYQVWKLLNFGDQKDRDLEVGATVLAVRLSPVRNHQRALSQSESWRRGGEDRPVSREERGLT